MEIINLIGNIGGIAILIAIPVGFVFLAVKIYKLGIRALQEGGVSLWLRFIVSAVIFFYIAYFLWFAVGMAWISNKANF